MKIIHESTNINLIEKCLDTISSLATTSLEEKKEEEKKKEFFSALWNAMFETDTRALISQFDGIPHLIDLLNKTMNINTTTTTTTTSKQKTTKTSTSSTKRKSNTTQPSTISVEQVYDRMIQHITSILCSLSILNVNKTLIAENKAIPLLIKLLSNNSKNDKTIGNACGTLGNLARSHELNSDEIVTADGVNLLFSVLVKI